MEKHSTKKLSQEMAISNLKTLHPTLDFSEFVYINNRTKGVVIHPDGKRFLLNYKHLSRGVTSNYNKTTKDIVEEFLEKFPDSKCDYSKVEYTGATSDITIICPHHGEFNTTPNRYLSIAKYPCPKCAIKTRIQNQYDSKDSFINKAKTRQGETYNYSKVIYKGSKVNVEIIHLDHSFWQRPNGHLSRGSGCTVCNASGSSKQEGSLVEFIKSLGIEFIVGDRKIIKPQELDIVIPSLRLAIEYNGLYYHSEAMGKDEHYHLNKTILCEKAGYRLIHVFEDEWLNKSDVVRNRLLHIMGLTTRKLFARKLSIKSLGKKETDEFLNQTHIQGATGIFSYSYGLYNGDELVSCMTFCKTRFEKVDGVELLRFSSKYRITGGFSKLLSYFLKQNPLVNRVISYSDRRWSQGNVYIVNGFRKISSSAPGYDYFGNGAERRYNRQVFMKHKLKDIFENFDENLTEVQNCHNNGFYRIWNCGMDKWELLIE